MICRKNSINVEASEISFSISYTSYDVWSWFYHMACLMHGNNKEMFDFAFNYAMTESEVIHNLTHDSKALAWMSLKHGEPVARWAINQALKQGYIIREGTKFLLSRKLAKKNRRTQEDDE